MSPVRLLKLRPRLRVLPIVAVCAICLGATSQSCRLGRDIKNNSDFSDFSVELELQNDAGELATTFDQQDRVFFVLSVTNTGDEEVTFEFPTARQADFAIVTDDNAEEVLWVASQVTSEQNTPTELEFAAGETKTFRSEAVLVDDEDGEFFPRGDYQAVGALNFEIPNFPTDPLAENDLASNPVPFEID